MVSYLIENQRLLDQIPLAVTFCGICFIANFVQLRNKLGSYTGIFFEWWEKVFCLSLKVLVANDIIL